MAHAFIARSQRPASVLLSECAGHDGAEDARARQSLAWYLATRMTRVTNFGDPSFEPTDEELAELMREAFADVPARSAAALSRIRQEIEDLRVQAMARLEQRLRGLK
ncbi:MAG: hypothetical protein H7138_16915 [Myxococcales bacterium]|nr:hypothetical protein [Myxococcales bacterium]